MASMTVYTRSRLPSWIWTCPKSPSKPKARLQPVLIKLFADDTNLDPQGDGEVAQVDQEKSVEDGIRQLEVDQTVEEKEEETLVVSQ